MPRPSEMTSVLPSADAGRNPVRLFIVFILLPLLLVVVSLVDAQGDDSLRVSYIDVGQGDSILLHASDGTDVLIDGGIRSAGPTVVAYLQSEGIDDIEVMVVSHGHADHIGGLIDVLRSTIPVSSVVYNGDPCSTTTCLDFFAETQNRGLTPTPAKVGQSHSWGAMDALVLNPQLALTGDQNEDSVVLLVTYGDRRFLFTGDIGSSTEQIILGLATPVAADVLKVAHHGSKYSSSADFLDAVGPKWAIISVGENSYGHPTQEMLDRLAAAGALIRRTDRSGTVVVTSDGRVLDMETDFVFFLPLMARGIPGEG